MTIIKLDEKHGKFFFTFWLLVLTFYSFLILRTFKWKFNDHMINMGDYKAK